MTTKECFSRGRSVATRPSWTSGRTTARWSLALLCVLALIGCGGKDDAGSGGKGASAERGASRGGGGSRGGPPGGFGGGPPAEGGVPVRTATVLRAPIALFFETNGTLEAENDVELVARVGGPIVELAAEEGDRVRKGQRLARIDDSEVRAQLAVAQVRLDEAKQAFERVESLFRNELVSKDDLDSASASYEAAQGELERTSIQLGYTEVVAPFDGIVVTRFVRFAETLGVNARLFRLSDFDPLLCPIQVPERELARLRVGQPAELETEAWPDHRFQAKVQRISPVVDAATGTIRVTLEVAAEGKLRPGMFASVYLEMERRSDALVIPKQALALDSLGDTVFVVEGETAARRNLKLGFENADQLEVVEGLAEGETVIVVGQDGLSDGTPVEILGAVGEERSTAAADTPSRQAGGGPGGPGGGGPGGGAFGNLDLDDEAQVERVKGFMRQRGMSDEQIEQRLERMRARAAGGDAATGPRTGGGPEGAAGGRGGPGGGPRGLRNVDLDDEAQVERVKGFMRQRGLSDEQIEQRLEQMRARRAAGGGGGEEASGGEGAADSGSGDGR